MQFLNQQHKNQFLSTQNNHNHFAIHPSFRIFFKHYISCSKVCRCTQVVEMQENSSQKNDMTSFYAIHSKEFYGSPQLRALLFNTFLRKKLLQTQYGSIKNGGGRACGDTAVCYRTILCVQRFHVFNIRVQVEAANQLAVSS